MNVFFSDTIDGDEIKLSEKESHHCINVKRCKNGDLVEILDGKGTRYVADIVNTSKKSVLLKIKQKKMYPNNLPDFLPRATDVFAGVPIICNISEKFFCT